ncbi:AbrB/MazE/SpoVT family DNA-binding domain-containing protein [Kaistella sp.]|uniref:AbrB/MazE/SpoVT family DNA-binding domain-containing protein n=1 Tax=Kaistella sp. TaxID=2782235 RepID=UPI003C6BABE3
MKTKIRKIGNSSGVILSKKMLEELNIEPKDELELIVKDGKILIQKVAEPRENWKEQFVKAGSLKGKTEIMDFSNKFDEEEWTW